jgi:hypothetical protein
MTAALNNISLYLIATVFAVAILFLFYYIRSRYQRSQAQALLQLGRLTDAIFTCLTSEDYPDNLSYYERRVQKQKIKSLARMGGKQAKFAYDNRLSLLEIIMDMGQIRRRVKDHTIFGLCKIELTNLSSTIIDVLAMSNNKARIEQRLAALEQAINQFDDVYEHVLKVTAREPIVFILFMSSLRILHRLGREASDVTSAPVGNQKKLFVIDYPSWVFVPEHNRYLRAGTSTLLIQLGGISETLFSLDFYTKQVIESYLIVMVVPQLAQVAAKNSDLLKLIYAHFAEDRAWPLSENLTNDVTELQQALRMAMPDSLELLDVTPDHVTISALARDVMDMREILLAIITNLPIDHEVSVE